ncbi:hypothetical protein L6164_023530 [Bauhinia variegata]|uniref:Uncharacterized protein n=1 Tax=Bauhinia variegata TaxID=167791 RepID=A0ACB9MNJ9_BAUVA|nr:hypothetical protein L6164_023530 [Bauhinia variegata]
MEAINVAKNPLTSLCSVKLDKNNYLLRKSTILPMLRGHKLDSYILGTKPCPEPFIIDEYGRKANPAYEERVTNNQLLLGWLLNSMSQEIATQLLHCQTSKELWEAAQSLSGAYTSSIQDSDLYFDSDTDSHVTRDPNRFQEVIENDGKSKLIVGNGEQLNIHATSSSVLNTCQTQTPLKLKDILYVPRVTKSLLSISKLASDNNIMVEFHANSCFVKDKIIGMVLLAERVKDGLYQLFNKHSDSNKGSYGFLSIKEEWHRKLGHPNSRILDEVMKNYKVQILTNEKLEFCTAELGLASTTERNISTIDKSPQPVTPHDSKLEIKDSTSNGNIAIQQDSVDIQQAPQLDNLEQASQLENHDDEQHQTTIQHQMVTRSKYGIFKPKPPYVGTIEIDIEDKEPETASEAHKMQNGRKLCQQNIGLSQEMRLGH